MSIMYCLVIHFTVILQFFVYYGLFVTYTWMLSSIIGYESMEVTVVSLTVTIRRLIF